MCGCEDVVIVMVWGTSASPQIFNETFVVKMVIAIVSPLDEKRKKEQKPEDRFGL